MYFKCFADIHSIVFGPLLDVAAGLSATVNRPAWRERAGPCVGEDCFLVISLSYCLLKLKLNKNPMQDFNSITFSSFSFTMQKVTFRKS